MTDKELRMIRGIARTLTKICRSMEKNKHITELERNSLRSTLRVLESTLQITDVKVMRSNLVVAMKTMVEIGTSKKNYDEFLKHNMLILTSTPKDLEREKVMEQIKVKITSPDTNQQSEGFIELRKCVKDSGIPRGETFTGEAIESMKSRDRGLSIHSTRYMLELVSNNGLVFEEHRDDILGGLNSPYPEVRVLTSIMCSRVRKVDTIEDLLTLCEDLNEINVNELEIPTHSSKFPVEHGMAKVKDIVNDCIFSIVDSTKNPASYISLSLSWNISGVRKEGEEFVLTLKVKPIVNFKSLTFNLTKLGTFFDLQGRTSISMEDLQQAIPREIYIRAIPKSSGHLASEITVTTADGLSYELIIEDFFEKKAEKRISGIENSVDQEERHNLGVTDQMELIVRDIRTMETKNVINALDQLKHYVAGDDTYESRISAMSVNLSLKGTDRITESEMNSILEMVEHIKNA